MADTDTEVFRSNLRADCHDRAFMLAAVGISSAITIIGPYYVLMVAAADHERAQSELRSYAAESRPPIVPAVAPPRTYPNAWVGCLCYVALLIGIDLAIANGWWRLDAFDLGELDAAQIQGGQWWRAVTALTLHLDGSHLAANLAAGVWFGYLAAREIGSGMAWLLVVIGAALANLFEGWFGPSTHLSVGASTAVFTALGLMVAHSWRRRYHLPQRWALRWAPLIAGAVLLGWFGSGGEGGDVEVDVVAHALGFVFGCLLGGAAALPLVSALLERVPQWLAGAVAVLAVGAAWSCALLR
jgi:membrane associated rhomboid family serine protease